MKKGIMALLFVLILSGCQEEKTSPYDVLDDYIKTWKELQFEDMYNTYLSNSSKETYTYELFSEKYEKLYGDLEIENLAIDIQEEELPWEEESTITIPGLISFDTFAGKVEYESDFVLEKVTTEEEQETWHVHWGPGFILPNLEVADKVRIETSTAERGEIIDSEGNPLAQNGEVLQVGVVPGEFNEEESLSKLSKIINMDEEYIKAQYTLSWAQPDYVMPVKKFLLDDEQTVRTADEIPGVSVSRVKERIYPYREAAAHLIGYIGEVTAEDLEELEGYSPGDRVGKRGLEQLLEEKLRAINGHKIYLEKEDGTIVNVVESDSRNGETVKLTINGNMQQTLFETLQEEAGTAAVIDPASGKVRSIVSLPTFDPNAYVLGISLEQKEALENDPQKPTINRFSYTYSPGSTMKLLTSIIGLENGSLDPSYAYDINEKQWQKDSSWGDYKVTRYYENETKVDLENGLKYSDNIYFARVGIDMGAEKFQEGLIKLGIGEALPFIYPTVKSQLSNSESIESEILLADTAYGQGEILLNIVHLASIFGGVVNNGNMMHPLLLEEEEETVWKEAVVSEEQAKLLQTSLRKIVSEGSSQNANVANREMAGKTGTSEQKLEQGTTGTENGLFVAYDQKKPELLTAMLIEGVEKKNPSGSTYTVGLTKKFYEALEITQR